MQATEGHCHRHYRADTIGRALAAMGISFMALQAWSSDALWPAYIAENPSALQLRADYTYFDEQLDVIDYLDSLGSSSRPDEYEKPTLEQRLSDRTLVAQAGHKMGHFFGGPWPNR